MSEVELKILPVPHEGIKTVLPRRATPGSAGLDLSAAVASPVEMKPGARVRIPTGIAVGLPGPEYVGLVFARSGLAVKHGIALSNGVGVIDSDYTGEIIVGLYNFSAENYLITPGERIAQYLVVPVCAAKIVEVRSLVPTQRSSGGFGSTGRH